MMLTINDALPCSICGAKPFFTGGDVQFHTAGRIRCPNYKSREILHGNLNSNRNGLTMGFTNWCYSFWTEEQTTENAIPLLVKEWNYIQENHITNGNFYALLDVRENL